MLMVKRLPGQFADQSQSVKGTERRNFEMAGIQFSVSEASELKERRGREGDVSERMKKEVSKR